MLIYIFYKCGKHSKEYLPKGEHHITTKTETTLIAFEKALDLLEENGIILMVIYPGHEEGKAEKEALEKYAEDLNQKQYNVAKLNFINQINNPPMLLIVEKR